MAETDKSSKKPPRGGRKGGTLYPKLNLKQALDYGEKLVSKTHTGAQPAGTILPGVFGNAGPVGKVRVSALKQFGLLEGDPKAYQATELAKKIVAATPEERPASLRLAFLNSKLFKQIFETYHGDTVTKAKIKQRALSLDVHPDSADECVELFVDSAVTAGLGTINGDSLALAQAAATAVTPTASGDSGGPEEEPQVADAGGAGAEETVVTENIDGAKAQSHVSRTNKAGVTVNLNVDSSSDPDKLQKQLELLRKFGMI